MKKIILLILSAILLGCNNKTDEQLFFSADNENFKYSGRHAASSEGIALISSAASVETKVIGDSIGLIFKSETNQHHYIAVELNDEYLGRYRVQNDTLRLALPKKDAPNKIKIFKDTEAANGDLTFVGLEAKEIKASPEENKPLIEFIGDSITCGMGSDTSELACDAGEWYDQHNAYMAYGPRVARALNVNYRLNCVSGMGMYRNWNDEDQPVMPDVYDNMRLNADSTQKVDFSGKAPAIVSIALGTNDLSYGDGKKLRKDFDQEKFVNNYVEFVDHIFHLYPNTQVALLSSPMVGEKKKPVLEESLQKVKSHFNNKPIVIFNFQKMNGQGCATHPDLRGHQQMSQALIPFFRNLIKKS